MRNPQSIPVDSPATQPYNQGVKPAFAMQQPMGFPTANGIQVANNPNTAFGIQQPPPLTAEPISPTPGYEVAPQQSPHALTNQNPVTPTSLYGQEQQQNRVTPPPQLAMPSSELGSQQGPTALTNQNQPLTPTSLYGQEQNPVTPPMQFAMPSNEGGSQQGPTTLASQNQPALTPTSLYGQEQQQNPVTPPMQFAMPSDTPADTGSTPAADSNEDDFDFFGGPPMGGTSPTGNNGSLAELRGTTLGPVPDSTNTDTEYQGVVQEMGALTVSSEQPQPQYQNYAVSPQNGYGGANNSSVQQQMPPYPQTNNWRAPQQQLPHNQRQQQVYQPYNQQQQQQVHQPYNQQQQQAGYSTWNSFAQPPQQQAYPVPADPWNGGDCFAAPQGNHLPSLNHPPQPYGGSSPYGANNFSNAYPMQANAYPMQANPYNEKYVQNSLADEDSQDDTEPERACADHKSSHDVMREYGAGLKALRLLDETTTSYNEEDYEDGGRRSGGFKQAAKEEHAKQLKAKQIRKMKKLEYKNKNMKKGLMAESSRTSKNVRRGVDPELVADKSQLDFDRQSAAQMKALKLMSTMF